MMNEQWILENIPQNSDHQGQIKQFKYTFSIKLKLINDKQYILNQVQLLLINIQKIQNKIMVKSNILSFIKRKIKCLDIFSSSVILQYKKQPQHKTFIGAFFSIVIIILICLSFYEIISRTFSLERYTVQTRTIKSHVPNLTNIEIKSDSSKFMFGIQILPLNLSDPKRYFDIALSHQILRYGINISEKYFDLQPCTKKHWEHYTPLVNSFQSLRVGNWLCPTSNLSSLKLQGKYSSQLFSQYEIKVSACINDTNNPQICHSREQITNFFQSNRNLLYFTVYFINPIINSFQKEHISYYLQDENYAIFGPTSGTENYLLFTDYSITSDYNIWLFEENVFERGTIAQRSAQKYAFQTNPENGKFISFYFAKSSNSLVIKRSVQKITQIFAYIEGTVVAFITLCFIIKQYAHFSFQITLAYDMFQKKRKIISNKQNKALQDNANLQEQIKQIQIKDIIISVQKQEMKNYAWGSKEKIDDEQNDYRCDNKEPNQQNQQKCLELQFLLYYFYKLCGCCTKQNCQKSQEMNYIQQCEEEMENQLDVKSLLSRLIFLQFCSTYVLQNYQLEGLKQIRPRTTEQIKTIRQKCQKVMSKETKRNQKQPKVIKHDDRSHKQRMHMIQQNKEQGIQFQVSLQKSSNKMQSQEIQKQQQIEVQFEKNQKLFANKARQRNKYLTQQRKSYLLDRLRQNAEQGNLLSEKIWKQLIQKPA